MGAGILARGLGLGDQRVDERRGSTHLTRQAERRRHVPPEDVGGEGLEPPRRGALEARTAGLGDLVPDPAGLPEGLREHDPQVDVALGVGSGQLEARGLVEVRQCALQIALVDVVVGLLDEQAPVDHGCVQMRADVQGSCRRCGRCVVPSEREEQRVVLVQGADVLDRR